MGNLLFNANEVLDIAKRIEHNGVEFYQAAAKILTDADSVALMNNLAEMEIVHEQIFDNMQKHLTADEMGDTPYDPHDDAYIYLKNMADKFVFNPSETAARVLTPGTSAKAILEFAIDREKDSIIFYEGIKTMVPEKLGSKKLDEVIAQEMGHVIILTRHLDRLS